MKAEYAPFDISDHLDSDETIAGYLTAAAEDEDPNVLLGALAHVAKARGMAQVAKAAGLGRESLYKTLAPGSHPRFETIQAILRALNVQTTAAVRVESPGRIAGIEGNVGRQDDVLASPGQPVLAGDDQAAALVELEGPLLEFLAGQTQLQLVVILLGNDADGPITLDLSGRAGPPCRRRS